MLVEALTASSVEAGAEPRFLNFYFIFQSIALWFDKGHPPLLPTFFKVVFFIPVSTQ